MADDGGPGSGSMVDESGGLQWDVPCFKCGYNLRSLPAQGVCPRCGEPIEISTHGYRLHADDGGRVIGDLACVQCGYLLRTLPITGVCPECATAVVRAVHGYYLRFASTEWVRRLARGLLLVLIALGALFVGYVIFTMGIAVFALRSAAASGLPLRPPFVAMTIMGIVALGLTGLLITGLVWVTRREPGGREEKRFCARRLTRACLWLLPLPLILSWVMEFVRAMAPGPMLISATWYISIVSGVVSFLACVMLPLALLRHLMGLLRRIPRPGLLRFAQIEFWGVLADGALFAGGYAVMLWLIFASPAWAAMAASGRTPVVVTAGPPNLTALGYTSTAPSSPTSPPATNATNLAALGYTTTAPAAEATASWPTSVPAGVPQVPPMPPAMFGVAMLTGFSGCGGMILFVAYVIFLILTWRALVQVLKVAATIVIS